MPETQIKSKMSLLRRAHKHLTQGNQFRIPKEWMDEYFEDRRHITVDLVDDDGEKMVLLTFESD